MDTNQPPGPDKGKWTRRDIGKAVGFGVAGTLLAELGLRVAEQVPKFREPATKPVEDRELEFIQISPLTSIGPRRARVHIETMLRELSEESGGFIAFNKDTGTLRIQEKGQDVLFEFPSDRLKDIGSIYVLGDWYIPGEISFQYDFKDKTVFHLKVFREFKDGKLTVEAATGQFGSR